MGISATATDAQNNTSELSNCAVVRTHGSFEFAPKASIAVDETAGSLVVTVARVGGDAGTVTVDYATVAGHASRILPRHRRSRLRRDLGNADVCRWRNSKSFTIPIFDDKLYESNEIFDIVLSKPTGGAILLDCVRDAEGVHPR